jgi:hypothetical protein
MGVGPDIREAETVKLTINGTAFMVVICPVEFHCGKRQKHLCDGRHPHKDCPMRKGITFKLEEEKPR